MLIYSIIWVEKDDEVIDIYWAVELKCRRYTSIMIVYVCIQMIVIFVSAFIQSIYCIFVGNRDPTTWNLPLYISLPLDTTHIFGWYVALFIEVNMDIAYNTGLTATTLYMMCCCIYIEAICDHTILKLNTTRPTHQATSRSNNERLQQKNASIISKAVQMHIQATE